MMKEEFEQLTGVLVSLKYYESVIEPAYVEDNQDKNSEMLPWCQIASWEKLSHERGHRFETCIAHQVIARVQGISLSPFK
ncbi:MAG: hypothetical protein LBI74_04770 [Synergistaceae bacterium]|jgi:hypothetical protein|nr:hypothetical protein [Synergistaceae bacterium]